MIKTFLQRFWIVLISAAGLSTLTILACAGGDWDGTEGSMFSPDIIDQPSFRPFFRTQATAFYDGYDDKSAGIFKNENCKDWVSYFGGKFSEDAMNYWLYKASLNQVDSMIFDIKNKPAYLTETSKLYSLKNMETTKATAFLYYLGYAKRNEVFAAVGMDDIWEPKPAKEVSVSMEKQIAGGTTFLSKAKDNFMKERYAFQLQRLYFYDRQYEKSISVYEGNKSVFTSENNLKWRALSYKAGALYRLKRYAEANYLFSQIFDAFEPLKKSAFLCFHPQQQADWEACLALAKTAREKEVLWQLLGLHVDAVRAMKEILKLNPKSDLADILLVRAVNGEEEKFDGRIKVNDNQQSIPATIDKELLSFLNDMSEKNIAAKPEIWHLSAAYLNYIQRNLVLGDAQLKRAEPLVKKNPLVKTQYHLISVIGKMARLQDMNPAREKELLPDLEAVFNTEHIQGEIRVYYAKSWLREVLSYYAEKNGEIEKAELISPETASMPLSRIEDITKMISYFDKQNKSDYENLFFKNALLGKNEYIELKAIRYAQQDKLEEALAAFKLLPAYKEPLPGNPFTIHIRDCHDCDHEAVQKTKYTNVTFIAKLLEMKATAVAKPQEAAQNYFLIANGFYNMTYFGNARSFYGYNNVNGSFYYYGDHNLPEQRVDQALKYYLLARDNSTDKEFRAKCTFMASKCELNTYYVRRPNDATEDFKSGIYFAALKKEYSTTKYYKDVIKECGYFRTYLGY